MVNIPYLLDYQHFSRRICHKPLLVIDSFSGNLSIKNNWLVKLRGGCYSQVSIRKLWRSSLKCECRHCEPTTKNMSHGILLGVYVIAHFKKETVQISVSESPAVFYGWNLVSSSIVLDANVAVLVMIIVWLGNTSWYMLNYVAEVWPNKKNAKIFQARVVVVLMLRKIKPTWCLI